MNIKIYIVLFLLTISLSSFGEEFKGEYEEGYIEITINKKITYSFFPVYMDYQAEEPYVSAMNLFALIRARGMKLDQKNKNIYGRLGERDYNFYYGDTNYINGENDVYIRGTDLSKVFNLSEYKWSTETYIMKLQTKFTTPYEISIEREKRLKGLKEEESEIEEDNIYFQDRKLFTPGVLRPKYTNYGVENSEGIFSTRYDTQLLYGDFTTTGFFYPDLYMGYTALRYNEIIDDKSIIIGDAYMQTYDFLGSKRLTGLAIQNWNGAGNIEIGQTSIRGFAPFNSTVELYRNGTLYRFTRVGEDGSYIFENINIQNYNDRYTIKIYNFDGSIEVKQVSMMSGSKILKKGKFDYTAITGIYRKMNEEEEEDVVNLENKNVEGNIMLAYGITNNFTTSIEYINSLKNKRSGNTNYNFPTELIGLNFYYTTGAVKYPTYFEFSEVYDLKGYNGFKTRYNHLGKIRQKIGHNVLSLEGYMYGDYISFLEEYQNRYIADWRGTINNYWGYSIRYDNIDKWGYMEQYGSSSIYRNKDNRSHELGIIYPFSHNYGTPKVYYNYSNSNLKIFNTNLNFILQINSDYEEYQDETDIKVGLKTSENKKLKAGFYVKYNTKEEYEIGFEIKYKVFKWLELIGDIVNNQNNTTHSIGVDMEKTIILEKPFTKNSNPYPTKSWMEGKVYIDTNDNNEYDDGEDLLEGIEIKVGNKKATTNKKGEYFLDNISSYEVKEFEVNPETLDPMLEPANEKKYVKLYPATGGKMNIPIQVISVIMGDLTFKGEAVDGIKHFPIISQLYIQLKTLDGKLVMEQRLEPEGFYMLEKVLPGEYLLEMDYRGEGTLTFEKPVKKINIKMDKYGSYYENYNFKVISYKKE
jgi:hypothetical protein